MPTPEQVITTLQSQRSVRAGQDRNALLQRQQQLQEQQRQVAEIQRQQQLQRQQQQNLSTDRESLKQSALNYLVVKGKANEAYRQLSPQEQEQVREEALSLEKTRATVAATQAVVKIEEQLGQSLNPEIRQQLIKQGVQTGQISYQTPNINKSVNSYTNAQYMTLAPNEIKGDKVVFKTPLFRNTPQVYVVSDKARQLYQSPTGVSIRETLSGKAFARAQATSGNKVVYNLNTGVAELKGNVAGTPEYEKAVQSSMTGQTLSTAVLGSIAGVPRIPKVVKVPIRQPTEPLFFELQQPIMKGGKQQTISSYQIIQETRPPMIKLSSSKLGLLGKSDELTITPSKYKITTGLPSLTNKPVVTVSTTSGKVGTIDTISGVSAEITPEYISKLSKTQQYIFKKLGSKPLASQELKLNIGEISKQKTGYAVERGKSISRYETASRTIPTLETPEFRQYYTEIGFKDITFPNARGSGKVPMLKGQIRVIKNPIILDDLKDVNFIKPNPNIQKTPLSVIFAKQEVIQTPKPIPSKVPKVKTQIIYNKQPPRISGNIGLLSRSTNGYATRSYSTFNTDFVRGFQDFNRPSASAQVEITKPTLNFQQLSIQKTMPSQININVPKQISVQLTKQIPKTLEITKSISREQLVPKEVTKNIEVSKLIQSLRNKQALKLETSFKASPKYNPYKPKPTERRTGTPNIRIPKFDSESLVPKLKTDNTFGVGIEIKRFGKFQTIGKESSLGKALSKAARLTDVTLARSFRLRSLETGELVDIKSLPVGFRRSKALPKTFVEESRYALSTGGEKKEIKYFKKAKNTKRRSFI